MSFVQKFQSAAVVRIYPRLSSKFQEQWGWWDHESESSQNMYQT